MFILMAAPSNPAESTGYCVKCRQKRAIKEAKAFTTKNGKNAVKGVCATCGTTIVKLG